MTSDAFEGTAARPLMADILRTGRYVVGGSHLRRRVRNGGSRSKARRSVETGRLCPRRSILRLRPADASRGRHGRRNRSRRRSRSRVGRASGKLLDLLLRTLAGLDVGPCTPAAAHRRAACSRPNRRPGVPVLAGGETGDGRRGSGGNRCADHRPILDGGGVPARSIRRSRSSCVFRVRTQPPGQKIERALAGPVSRLTVMMLVARLVLFGVP